ncbi:MAG: terminase [Pyrinomonadaceae bacterium]|nr:terminase [Pyrinomonadaceae bacterium]
MDLELHHKQGVAFLSKATEILYGGAAGGGKSHLMRVAALCWCVAVPGLQVYLFRRTRPELLKNHMEGPTGFPALLAKWIQSRLVKINYSELTIEFKNGSKIFLCHCQYKKDLSNYQGTEIHVLLMDELTHFIEDIYRFLRGRVRLGGLKVPIQYRGMFPRILCGSNPGSIGHNWVKLAFVDACPPMQILQMPKAEGGMYRQFIPALLEDNPTLNENDPDYELRLEGLGHPELVRAMRRGDWDIVAGGMFDDLWKRDTHVIEPFEIPKSWHVDRSFDWGSSKPFSVLWWAETDGTEAVMANDIVRGFPKGTIFLINEWYGWNGRANEGLKMLAVDVAKRIKTIDDESRFKVKPGPADNSIYDAENGVSIAEDMRKAGVAWTRSDKSPGSRKTGWERIRRMLKASTTQPMEEPGLFVFNTCVQWIRTVPVLSRDQNHSDDVDTLSEDHAGDSSRYRLMNSKQSVKFF